MLPREYRFLAYLMEHSNRLVAYLGEGGALRWQDEFSIQREQRPDLLAVFYGRVQSDLIEIKGPLQPLLCLERSERPRHLKPHARFNAHLQQLYGYRDAFQFTGQNVGLRPPRMVLIGDVSPAARREGLNTDVDQQKDVITSMARASKEWAEDYDRGALVILTWDMLARHDADTPSQLEKWVRRTAPMGFFGKFSGLLSDLQRSALDARFEELGSALQRMRLQRKFDITSTFSTPPELMLAEIATYRQEGDLPVGPWMHGDTHQMLNLLGRDPSIWDQLAQGLENILRFDRAESVIGRATHLLRYAPPSVMRDALRGLALRDWTFPEPRELLDGKARHDLAAYAHVGYCLAWHGDEAAINFLNRAARDKQIMTDLGRWNVLHAGQGAGALMASLKDKAEGTAPRLQPFKPWHRAIADVTRVAVDATAHLRR